jgi:hypothetical protein
VVNVRDDGDVAKTFTQNSILFDLGSGRQPCDPAIASTLSKDTELDEFSIRAQLYRLLKNSSEPCFKGAQL